MKFDIDSLPASQRLLVLQCREEMFKIGVNADDFDKFISGEWTLGFTFGVGYARKAVKENYFGWVKHNLEYPFHADVPEGIFYFADCYRSITGTDFLAQCV